jgi:two-component system LytT family sensor kinase
LIFILVNFFLNINVNMFNYRVFFTNDRFGDVNDILSKIMRFISYSGKQKKAVMHAFCWLLFILYEQSDVYFSTGKFPLAYNLFYYGCNIALFYLHYTLLNRTAGDGRFWPALLLTPVELVFIVLVKFGGNIFFEHDLAVKPSWYQLSIWDLHRSLYFIGAATLLWSVRRVSRLQKQTDEAEKQQLTAQRDQALLQTQLSEARTAYYQHQLNPHLLFNALNFIYSEIAQHSARAAKGVLLLSDILRFTLADAGAGGRIPLNNEIAQMRNLEELNRLRFGDRLAVIFEIEGATEDITIIPLVLLTLVENVYKHGLITDKDHPANIRLAMALNGTLRLHIENQKSDPDRVQAGRGLGIRNTRIRLENLYPGGFNLHIDETVTHYRLELTIAL